MVRRYKKQLGSRPYANYNPKYLQAAITAVQNKKMSARQASEHYGIPRSTLGSKLRQEHQLKPGGQPVINEGDENYLVRGILRCAEWGFPLTPLDIKILVKGWLDRQGIRMRTFRNNLPGNDWVKGFLKRHCRELTVRLSENIKRARAEVSKEMVEEFFKELETTLENVEPENIYNFDETNFCDDAGRVKVIVKRSTKHADRIMDNSKSAVSVMMTGNACGKVLPPYVCYKAENLWESWTQNGPFGCRYNRTKSGWFDQFVYEDYFSNHLLPVLKESPEKKVIICDNLSSHLSLHVINECTKYNIAFILLPPNSTHLLQPLDVAYFKPLKAAWRKVLTNWKLRNKGVLPKDRFPSMLKAALDELDINSKGSNNLKSGFAATGIFPLNPEKVLKKLPGGNPNPSSDPDNWTESFVDILKECRFNKNITKIRRKKLKVKPGRGVTASNIREDSDDKQSDREIDDNDAASTEDIEDSRDEDLDVELNNPPTKVQDGDFILTKFEVGKQKQLKYVGRVLEIQSNSKGDQQKIKVDFLRPQTTRNDIFIYPDVQDVSFINLSQIICVLQTPKELRRNRFQFNYSVY